MKGVLGIGWRSALIVTALLQADLSGLPAGVVSANRPGTALRTGDTVVRQAAGDSRRARIDAWLKQEAREGRFSGAVLIARGGRPVYEAAFGFSDREARRPNTTETPFNICSMGKMFTAATAMLLVQEGRLDLHTPLARYLPDFPRPPAERITLHHLLSHTAGLGNYMAGPGFERDAGRLTTIESLYARVLRDAPLAEPGARFSYSNSGFIVVGRLIERVTGMPYAEAVDRLLLAPSGMTHTRFYPTDRRPGAAARGYVPDGGGGFAREPAVVPQPASDGGVHSTLADLLAFDRLLHGAGVLSERSRRLMMTPNLNGYGYGLSIKPPEEHVSRRRSVGHTGGLFDRSAVLRRFVDDEVTVIVLANLPDAAIVAAKEIERLYFDAAPPRSVGGRVGTQRLLARLLRTPAVPDGVGPAQHRDLPSRPDARLHVRALDYPVTRGAPQSAGREANPSSPGAGHRAASTTRPRLAHRLR